ncbi:MAG: BTAD domain-containing putative transcriptional regulator [Gaiellaceae bacterium]
MPLSFRLLGPLEVQEDGREIELGSGRQRALLALLLVHANEVVSVDRLIDDLWAESPPASAQKVIQGYVSHLRRVLPANTIETQGPGYVLVAGETDAGEFARLVEQASTLGPIEAAPLLRSALALWRGRALDEFEYEDWAQAEIALLDEQRLAALEARVDADLSLGRHAHVVPELEGLVAQHPVRERFRGQLMVALYRSGRQADALEVYRRGRKALAQDLGLEPSPFLERLERQILTHDEALAAPPRGFPVPNALARRGRSVALIGAIVLAGAIAAAGWQLGLGSGGPAAASGGNSVVGIDPATGRVVARIAVGKTPTSIVAAAGSVWATSSDEETVTRIDAPRRRIVAISRLGADPLDLAIGGGALWLVNGRAGAGSGFVNGAYPDSVSRLDPRSSVVTQTIVLPRAQLDASSSRPAGASLLAMADGAVWAIGGDRSVSRIDTATGHVVRTIGGLSAVSIAAAGRAVWVDDGYSTLIRIDTRSTRVTERIPLAASSLNGIAVGGGAVWVADEQDGTVWRIDPDPRPVTRTISVGIGVTAVSYGGGAVWATNSFLGTVSRIDPETNTVTRTIDVAGTPQGVSADDRGIWVTVTGTPGAGSKESGVEALPASACGPVVTGGGKAQFLIASDLPLRGGAAGTTLSMTRAVEFVLQRHHFRAGGYAIGYQSCDDSTAQSGNYDFGTCGANAKAYASDPDLLGVIGPLNSPCALAEIPITGRARGGPVAVISPLTTDPLLTHPAKVMLLYPSGRRNYVRIIAPDDLQGAAQALLAHQLGLKRVYVLSDGQDFARNLLHGFTHAARKLAVHVAGTSQWDPESASYDLLVRRVARTGADGIVLAGYGGPGPGRLVRALRARLGVGVPLIVGDGFLTISDLLHTAGPAARGMYVTFAGRANERLPAAGRAFVRDFAGTQSNRNVPSYAAAYAAQATEVLLAAIARSDGTRGSVVRELFASKMRGGILGDFSFTREGDITPSPVTVFRVVGGGRRSTTFLDDFADSVVDRVVNVPASLAR